MTGNDDKDGSSSLRIKRLINSSDKGVGTARNVLAKLFRVVLVDLDMSLSKFDVLKKKWLNNPAYHLRNSRKAKATTCSNLTKDVIRDTMTVDVFLKMMLILEAESISVQVTMKRKNRARPTEHVVVIEDLPGYVTSNKIGSKPLTKEIVIPKSESFDPKGKTVSEIADEFDSKVNEVLSSLRE